MATPIFVVGYPRSGNTYLSELLGDVLNARIEGVRGSVPVGAVADGRGDEFLVHQAHLQPELNKEHKELLPNSSALSLRHWRGERIVGVYRNPRDVVASAWNYWQLPSIETAIRAVALGEKPMRKHGPMIEYIRAWQASNVVAAWTTFEALAEDPLAVLQDVLMNFDLEYPVKRLEAAIERQSFARRRKKVEAGADGMSYHEGIQNRHTWRGKVGNWASCFSLSDIQLAKEMLDACAEELGYDYSD